MSTVRIIQGIFLLAVLLQAGWHGVLQPPRGNGSWMLATFATVPLLLLLPGILGGRTRSMTWGAYLLVLYFVIGIMEAWSNPPQRIMALAQVFLTVLYFGFLTWLVRKKR